MPTNVREWQEEIERVTEKAKELLAQRLDLLMLITVNLDYQIEKPQDVFFALKQELGRV